MRFCIWLVGACFVAACSSSDGGGGGASPSDDGGAAQPGPNAADGGPSAGGDLDGGSDPDAGAPADSGTPDGGPLAAGLFANVNGVATQFSTHPHASQTNQFGMTIQGTTTNDPLTGLELDLKLSNLNGLGPGDYECVPANGLAPRVTVTYVDNVNHHDFPTTADAQVGACSVTVTAIGTTPGAHVVGTFTATTKGQGDQNDALTGGTFDVLVE